jgi:hypothetical protein
MIFQRYQPSPWSQKMSSTTMLTWYVAREIALDTVDIGMFIAQDIPLDAVDIALVLVLVIFVSV